MLASLRRLLQLATLLLVAYLALMGVRMHDDSSSSGLKAQSLIRHQALEITRLRQEVATLQQRQRYEQQQQGGGSTLPLSQGAAATSTPPPPPPSPPPPSPLALPLSSDIGGETS